MHDPEYEKPARSSKTRRKRDVEALQDLGSELLDFSEDELQQYWRERNAVSLDGRPTGID